MKVSKATIIGIEKCAGGELSVAQKLKNEILMLDAKWRCVGHDPKITIYLGRRERDALELDAHSTQMMGCGVHCDTGTGEARFIGKRIVPVALESYFAIEAGVAL